MWLVWTTGLLLVAGLTYLPYALWSMNRPSGSSLQSPPLHSAEY